MINNTLQDNYDKLDERYKLLLEEYRKLDKRFKTIVRISDKQLNQNLKELSKNEKLKQRTKKILKYSDKQSALLLKELNQYLKSNSRFDVIIKQSDKQGRKTLKSKYLLEDELSQEVKKNNQNQNLLIQQSKMAAMGEMIENITHQMQQPLSVIIMVTSGLKFKIDNKMDINNDIGSMLNQVLDSTTYISDTIYDFKNFFNKNKIKKEFFIEDIISKAKKLNFAKFNNKNITIIENIQCIKLFGVQNELIQVVMNIFSNSIDAMIEQKGEIYIFIDIVKKHDSIVIKIKDNANGIKNENIQDIFEAHFTTKKISGTGIGLYMSKEIIEKSFKGIIKVENKEFKYKNIKYKGAEFSITIPIVNEID